MKTYEYIAIQPHFAGGYRLQYDGKYITLFGLDNRYILFKFDKDAPDEYDEMVLVSCVAEVRKATPFIEYQDDKVIKVNFGLDNPQQTD